MECGPLQQTCALQKGVSMRAAHWIWVNFLKTSPFTREGVFAQQIYLLRILKEKAAVPCTPVGEQSADGLQSV